MESSASYSAPATAPQVVAPSQSDNDHDDDIAVVCAELHRLYASPDDDSAIDTTIRCKLTPAATGYLRARNPKCLDCDAPHPQWASVSFGICVCLECSGRHRSLGVCVSKVRSLTMDHWTYPELLHMLEGGNGQWRNFLERHGLLTSQSFRSTALTPENVRQMRYKTKAAAFYRQQLHGHVVKLLCSQKPYRGPRKRKTKTSKPRPTRLPSIASQSGSSEDEEDYLVESNSLDELESGGKEER